MAGVGFHKIFTALDIVIVTFTGDIVGQVGSSGLSTGPHLHFELRLAGKAIDPETLIRFDDLQP
ncbi:peptidoglycan DD-metalloendopeptidase family protein [candidate division KSB1 bacterium]|nr:peptidoglycan DD-metalloendopeptidase family protein [candidate division KSB1 bacterium]